MLQLLEINGCNDECLWDVEHALYAWQFESNLSFFLFFALHETHVV